MSKLSQLQGTHCQIEYIGMKENDRKRHRSRCIYYNKNGAFECSKYVSVCKGSSHCGHYKEAKKVVASSSEKEQQIKRLKTDFTEKKAPEKNWETTFPTGSQVQHKNLGFGKVKAISGEIITVDFEDCGVKKLSAKICCEKNILWKVR